MKRFVILLLTAVLALTMPLSALAAGQIEVTEDISVSDDYDWTRFKGQNVTLNVYNWGEYISNGSDDSVDVVAAFEKLTGIKVNYTTFDSNESLYAKLKSGAANYDVIIPSDYMVAKMISEGMLMPLDYSNIPNFQNIDEEYRNGDYDPENAYTVPYTLCTTGIIYNTKMVDEAPHQLGRPVGREVCRQHPDVQQQPRRLRHRCVQERQQRQPPDHGGCGCCGGRAESPEASGAGLCHGRDLR